MTHILDDLLDRGLVAQSTDLGLLRQAMDAGPVTYYCGFDPTAASLHVGSLVQILTLRRLQQAGHRPIALVGGATGLIGDPKPGAERGLQAPEVVASWVERLEQQISPFLAFDGPNAALLVNNLDWTENLSTIEFLREIGKHFRVNKMLTKEAVSARLHSDAGISYTEFSYQLLQALDFRELYRRHGCTLQTGGSDQWGNFTAGLDLLHRTDGATLHALSTPLVTKADGTKFGKSESGTVWLDPSMTSPYAFYQFWLNTADADVAGYLRLFSFLPLPDVEAIVATSQDRPAARVAARALAAELTDLVHGHTEREAVEVASRALFGQDDLSAVPAATLESALAEVPHLVTARDDRRGMAELLAEVGLCPSRSAARRAVDEGGAYVNNVRVTDADFVPGVADLVHDRFLVLRRGKRNLALVDRGRHPVR